MAKGDVAFGPTSQAADASSLAASLVSKDRKPTDEDFDAVLAMLLNGGIPLVQPLVFPVTVKVPESISVKTDSNTAESGTLDALETATAFSGTNTNAVEDSSVNSVGQLLLRGLESGTVANSVGDLSTGHVSQLLLQGQDAVTQQPTTFSPASARTVTALSGNMSNSKTSGSGSGTGLSLASTQSTNLTSAMESAAEPQKEQGVSSQFTEDVHPSPMQVLTIAGAAQDVDAAKSVKVFVLPEPRALVSAKPLSKEILQALEQVGRPTESRVVAEGIPQPNTAAIEVLASTLPELGLRPRQSPVAADSILALNSTSTVVSATLATPALATPALKSATTTSSQQSIKSTGDQDVRQISDLATIVPISEDSPSSISTLVRSSSTTSVKEKSDITATIESSKSIPDNAASTIGILTTGNEQIQRSKESIKRAALSDTDSLAFEKPKSQARSTSDLSAAAIQSGLTLSASLNSVPDLAASISAEIRQPLTTQVSQAIMDHVERNGARQSESLSVRLDPPELGEMTIHLSKTHEGLDVRVTAREVVTMDMLFARGPEIESQLRGQQLNLKSLEFQRVDMSNSGFSQGQGQGQSQQENDASRRSENLLNQIRGGTRGLSPISSPPRSVTTESNYGLSFRA